LKPYGRFKTVIQLGKAAGVVVAGFSFSGECPCQSFGLFSYCSQYGDWLSLVFLEGPVFLEGEGEGEGGRGRGDGVREK